MDELYGEEHEANVYGEAGREDLEENDEISPQEEAFMQGYENYEEEEDEEEDDEDETPKEE